MLLSKITFLTLFPEMYNGFINSSIINNAIKKNKIKIEVINFRDYSNNIHKKVDDYPYGGGPGMVISVQPIVDCLKHIKTPDSYTILLTPRGKIYNQSIAHKFAKNVKHLIIICGHYEGIDERIVNYIDDQISIGDYIMTGGELPSMMIADSVIRLIDGVINCDSLIDESFENNLLDYSVYTRPAEFDGYKVPSVLLSGNHNEIYKYRLNDQIKTTKTFRMDLYKKYLKKLNKEKNNVRIKN